MGNRAVITTAPFDKKNVGIYVHWNGGQESIEGFLAACKELGYRDPTGDTSYGLARLTQAIGLFFGAEDDCSVGIGRCDQLDCDNGDNGVWLLGPDWTIAGRLGGNGRVSKVTPVSKKTNVDKRDAIKNDILKLTENAKREHLVGGFRSVTPVEKTLQVVLILLALLMAAYVVYSMSAAKPAPAKPACATIEQVLIKKVYVVSGKGKR